MSQAADELVVPPNGRNCDKLIHNDNNDYCGAGNDDEYAPTSRTCRQ